MAARDGTQCETKKSAQLSALLLLICETSHEAFCLMDEGSQQDILTLAYELSLDRE